MSKYIVRELVIKTLPKNVNVVKFFLKTFWSKFGVFSRNNENFAAESYLFTYIFHIFVNCLTKKKCWSKLVIKIWWFEQKNSRMWRIWAIFSWKILCIDQIIFFKPKFSQISPMKQIAEDMIKHEVGKLSDK